MKALLIEFDVNTGKRAGGIDPNDPKLQCYGWQNLEVIPQLEIRVIEDERDPSQYESIKGVTILSGTTEINKAIRKYMGSQSRYLVEVEALFKLSIEQRGIELKSYGNVNAQEILKSLYKEGVAGIRRVKRFDLVKD